MLSHRVAPLLVTLALFPAVGCNCDPKTTTKDPCAGVDKVQGDKLDECTDNASCSDHYACKEPKDKPGLHCCIFDDRRCNTEADCCPGQTCPEDKKKCFDKALECDTDADCGDRGDRFCEAYSDAYGTSSRCRFHECGPLGECPEGQSCFKGECMAGLPCDGSCEPGTACSPTANRCQKFECPASCAPGFIATFNDNRNIWDACNLPAVACECAELPPLRSEDLGRFSALAVDAKAQAIYVSHYDGQYGDLVVNRYDPNGKLARQDYVDGVPSGAVLYGPSGARGGVVDPGEDVGRYTDVAVGPDGAVYVSYYDVTHGDLKLARRDASGAWTTVRVDGDTADLGLYTSVGVDTDGLPVISYFQKGGDDAFDATSCPGPTPTGDKHFITALKIARAKSPTPSGVADFDITTVACQSRPAPACYGCQQTCADPGSGPGCYAAATGCSSCDPNTETCVMVGSTPTCAKTYNPSNLNEVVDGVGLFSSLAVDGKDVLVAYMRRSGGKGQLEGVRIPGSGAPGPSVVLDDSGDTGFFPDLKIDPSTRNLAVAYHDFTSKKLKFLYNANFVTGLTPEVIDDGVGAMGSGESSWVGTDVCLAFAPSGALYAVYQDATRGDLKLAVRGTQWEVLSSPHTEGAVGFFADGAFLGNTLYMSHARIHARLISGDPHVDNALILDTFTAP
ncbi:MAG: hypothetical protein IRZ16_05945 [Myxococcaceae bacterium]|nr:hypothetical protein [Myxococcaceae bacterium]